MRAEELAMDCESSLAGARVPSQVEDFKMLKRSYSPHHFVPIQHLYRE